MNKLMTAADIQEILDRCELATPGPWKWNPGDFNLVHVADGDKDEICRLSTSGPRDAKNGNFIANARFDVLRLAVEVLRLRKMLGEMIEWSQFDEKCKPIMKAGELGIAFRRDKKELGGTVAELRLLRDAIRNGVVPDVLETDFDDPRNRKVFEAIRHLGTETMNVVDGATNPVGAITLVSVAEVLNSWGYMQEIGYDYLGGIWDA